MKRNQLNFALAAVGVLSLVGCDSKEPKTEAIKEPAAPSAPAPAATPSFGPLQSTDSTDHKWTYTEPHVQKGDIAVITTKMGVIKFEFLQDKAPNHVANFEKLAEAGFYDGTAFHRVKPGFMIQGGDPNTRNVTTGAFGAGDPGYKFPAEFNDTHFARGIVGMARSQDPDSAGSQFYIMVDDAPFLDNQYTAFGKVTEGMDVADKIVAVKTNGGPSDQVVDVDKTRVTSIKIIHPGAAAAPEAAKK